MPDWKKEIADRLASLNLEPVQEAEIIEELAQHCEDRYQEYLYDGVSETEACEAVLEELTDDETLAREVKRIRGMKRREPVSLGASTGNVLAGLWQDLRYSARKLIQNPGFTSVVLITLALGIGANTAMFSVVNTVLLNPLPFADSDRLIALGQNTPSDRAALSNFSFLNFSDLRSQSKAFERLAAYYTDNFTLTGQPEAALLRGAIVTADLFPLLGVSPALGRTFLPEEDRAGGGREGRPAILSWECWQQQFSGDPAIIGRAITLNNIGFTVVGVMPAGFRFPIQSQPTEVWVSAAIDYERKIGAIAIMNERGYHGWQVIGRLKPGIKPEQAQAEVDVIAASLAAQFPDINKDRGINAMPLLESMVGGLRTTLLLLLGAVGFVMLIACVNVANLLLERVLSRQRDITVRLALGASRWRIARQLLTESVMLAGLAGVVGTMLAVWGMNVVRTLSPQGIARIAETRLDARVLAFTALVSLATGVAFGLAPALIISRTNLAESLKEGGRSTSSSNGTRSLLVVVEIALALVLLVGAGLLIQSLVRLQQVKLGFDPHNVLVFNVAMPVDRSTSPLQIADFYRRLTERMKALPGVVNASVIFQMPLGGNAGSTGMGIKGQPLDPANLPHAVIHIAGPEYFRTMGIPLVKGRGFTEQDDLNSPPVLIINEALVRKYFPNEDPIGKHIIPGFTTVPFTGEHPDRREIVGVVADVKHHGLSATPQPEIYFAQAQMPFATMTVVARTANDPNAVINAARGVVQSLDKNAPVYGLRTVEELISRSVGTARFNTLLLGLFAAVALILTTIGLYGVISYAVSQATHEIGIRMALGAQSRDVMKLIIGRGLVLTFLGVAIGVGGAFGLTRLMSSLLFEITPTDRVTYGLVVLSITAVALIACYLPARRATKVDPLIALRYE